MVKYLHVLKKTNRLNYYVYDIEKRIYMEVKLLSDFQIHNNYIKAQSVLKIDKLIELNDKYYALIINGLRYDIEKKLIKIE